MWDEVVEKIVNVEAKTSFRPPSETREIDFRCPRDYWPSIKKDKDNANREHLDEVSKYKDKTKSYNSFSTNEPHTQTSKKCHGSQQGGYPAIEVNATKVAKKVKVKDLSHIECYIC